MSKKFLVIPPLLIVFAEALFFQGKLRPTLLVHGINILLCIMIPLFIPTSYYLYQAFSLVSVLRALNIGMPVFFPQTIYWLPLIYAPLIVSGYFALKEVNTSTDERHKLIGGDNWLQGMWVIEKDREELGRKWKTAYLPIGFLLGLIIANLEYRFIGPTKLIPSPTPWNLFVLSVVMFLFVGFTEELIYRSILQNRLQKNIGDKLGIVGASALFATMHSGYQSLPYIGFVFFVGLLIGYLFHKTQSIAFIAIIHGSINLFLFGLIPFGYLIIKITPYLH